MDETKNTNSINNTLPDIDADKSGTDTNSDSTVKRNSESKFEKPTRETNPDRTGIDINTDKIKIIK